MSIASSYWFVHSKVCKEGRSHVKGSYSNERERRKERKKEGRGEKEGRKGRERGRKEERENEAYYVLL